MSIAIMPMTNRPVPLRKTVLAVLSLAAEEGQTRIPITQIYRRFADLVEKYPGLFPPMLFTKGPYSAYSKRLDDALQSLIGYDVELPNPRLQFTEISKEAAKRRLARLKDAYGEEYLAAVQPIARDFLADLH